MSAGSLPEVWLRGPLPGYLPELMPAAHALLQAREDIERTAAAATLTELWFRPGPVGGTRELVVSGDGRFALRVRGASASTVRFALTVAQGMNGNKERTVSSDPVRTDAWHHVIASYREPTLRIWVDGLEEAAGGTRLETPLALDAIRIGGNGAAGGVIDELWLAPVAITDAESARARYCPP